MIPVEAVIAAAKALDLMRSNPATLTDYLSSESVARAALEAAAPHMLGEAWHKGYVSGLHNIEFYGATPNPYRPAP